MRAIGAWALLHLYVGWRVAPNLPWPAAGTAFLLLLGLGGLLVPGAFLARRVPDRRTADRWTWAGMLALGLFSMLLVLTVLRDVLLLAGWSFPHWRLAERTAPAVPLLALAAAAWGAVEARRTARVREVEVPIAGLPAALQGFTIGQISDVHVGPTVKRGYVQAIVEAVNRLDADAVAVTGDLVDGRVAELAEEVEPLARLRARHGSFFVSGNHEYYSGAPEWLTHLGSLGLRVLTNEHVTLDHDGSRLVLAGVSDWSAHHFVPGHRSSPRAALAGAPADAALRVLLAHQPRSAPEAAAAGFDLQLSGHTHGGQFWPWNLLVPLQQPFTAGLHRLGRLWVYTSRGTGYWGPPLRLGAPSEITRLRLVASAASPAHQP